MDIDDILASISGPSISTESRDLQLLTRAWVAERTAPEVLPYPHALIARTMDRIRDQIAKVEDMTGNMDPKTNFPLVVIQTELERFKFLIRSFLRARIAKIDKYAQHYLSIAQQSHSETQSTSTTSTTSTNLLSADETQYLVHHSTLLARHFSASFLSSFPERLQSLDDTTGGTSMVDAPDVDTAVFCRVLRDSAGAIEIQGENGVGHVELVRGDVWILRWSGIRSLVLSGDVELV